MPFYPREAGNIDFLIRRCFFEADQTRVSLALDRLTELGEQFPDDARIYYSEGILRRDQLGQGLRARDLFEKAYWAAARSGLQGDYCWSAASNTADLARDAAELQKWARLTETAPPLGHGNRPDFRSMEETLADGMPFRELQLQRASTGYMEGHIGSSAALMEVALAGGGLDAMEEVHIRRHRAQYIRELDQKCDGLREPTFEWFGPADRIALKEALAELDRALILDPYDAELWNLSAAWNNLLENFSEGLRSAEKAMELRTPYPKAHTNAAWALYRLGRYGEAEERIALAHAQAQELAEPGDIEQTERLLGTYTRPPAAVLAEDLELPLETLLRAAKRCSDMEMEAVQGDIHLRNLVDRLIDHPRTVTGASASGYVPLIAELLSDFTPETVCNAIINAKQRSPRLMDDWYYAALFIIANSSGVEKRDAARLVWLLLFIPLDANRVRDNYRHLVLAPSSARPLLGNLDTAMREELYRINPALSAFVTSQPPLTETEKAHGEHKASARLGVPRHLERPTQRRVSSRDDRLQSPGHWLRSIAALVAGFGISALLNTFLILLVAYLTFPLLSDETPNVLAAKLILLACSVVTDALAGFTVSKIVRRGRLAHAFALGIGVTLWAFYISPTVNSWRLVEIASTIPAMMAGAALANQTRLKRIA